MPAAERARAVRCLPLTLGDCRVSIFPPGCWTQAKEKNVYDELVKGELTEHLRGRTEAFDVIVSADTLVYFGCAGRRLSRPPPERCDLQGLADLHPGRCRTRRRALLATVSSCTAATAMPAGTSNACSPPPDWRREIAHADLRMESGTPVAGLVIRAVKLSSAGSTDLVRLDVVLEMDAGIQGPVGFLRLVLEVDLGEPERDVLRASPPRRRRRSRRRS